MARENLFEGRRVLLVEDDYLIVLDLVQELESSGAHVIGPVPDMASALALLSAPDSKISGAVIDISLRGQMAWPLADALMARGLPFAFASGYGDDFIPSRYDQVPRLGKPATARGVADALMG